MGTIIPPHRRVTPPLTRNTAGVGNLNPGTGTGTGTPDPEALTAVGFTRLQEIIRRPRLTVSTGGREKTGKTRFMLTAPGPIAFFNFDRLIEPELLELAKQYKREVYLKQYVFSAQTGKRADWEALWEEYKRDWMAAMRNFRTVIQDTGTATWELCRLARFGKLTQVSPHHYGPVNAEFDSIIKLPQQFDGVNCLISHRYKKEYKGPGAAQKTKAAEGEVKEMWTGGFERQGYGGTPFEMQLVIEHFQSSSTYDVETGNRTVYTGPDQYGIRVVSSGINGGQLTGVELRGADATFQMLGQLAFPDSNPEDWE